MISISYDEYSAPSEALLNVTESFFCDTFAE
jgi:hypothetical protein